MSLESLHILLCVASFSIMSKSVLEFGIELTVGNFLVDDSLSIVKALLETGSEGLVAFLTDCFFFTTSFGVFLFESSQVVLSSSIGVSFGSSADCLRVGVQSLHSGLVLQWVVAGGAAESVALSNSSEFLLNGVRVDDSSKISAGHQ